MVGTALGLDRSGKGGEVLLYYSSPSECVGWGGISLRNEKKKIVIGGSI